MAAVLVPSRQGFTSFAAEILVPILDRVHVICVAGAAELDGGAGIELGQEGGLAEAGLIGSLIGLWLQSPQREFRTRKGKFYRRCRVVVALGSAEGSRHIPRRQQGDSLSRPVEEPCIASSKRADCREGVFGRKKER